ncbi:MAG: DUF459 domain-containing protein [Acidimicrobiales bacterium]
MTPASPPPPPVDPPARTPGASAGRGRRPPAKAGSAAGSPSERPPGQPEGAAVAPPGGANGGKRPRTQPAPRKSAGVPVAKAAPRRVSGGAPAGNGAARKTAAALPAGRAASALLAGTDASRSGKPREAEAGATAKTATAGSGRRLVRSSGRSASAGRIIGVGLICFALWALLDANQLYTGAQNGGADGTRRTVSIDILRPVAALANALHLSGLVNWGDTVLNRNGGPGNSQGGGTTQVVTSTGAVCSLTQLVNGSCYLPHGGNGHGVALPPPRHFGPPPLLQPTAANPLTILDIGDSIGEDLGFGLGDVFSGDHSVKVIQEGLEDTGLVQAGYYNWPDHLQAYLNRDKPGAVVIMMGANDDQNMNVNGAVYVPLSGGWVRAYTARVDTLMEESTAAGAHVLWVGLPPMGGGNITNVFVKRVNTIFATEARSHLGVTFVPSWNLLAGPKGQFEIYKKINGSEVAIRSTDGIHLDPAGWDLLAQFLVKPMQEAWKINLRVAG